MTENVTNLQKFVPTLPYMVGTRYYGSQNFSGTAGPLYTTQTGYIFRLFAISMNGNISPVTYSHIEIRDNLSAQRFFLYTNSLTFGGTINTVYNYSMPFELPEGWSVYVGIGAGANVTISIYGEIIGA